MKPIIAIFFIISLLLTSISFGDSNTEAGSQAQCPICQIADSLKQDANLTNFIWVVRDRLNMDRCQNFSKANSLGPWGKLIIEQLESGRFPRLYSGTNDLRKICPRYSNMPKLEKDLVWVLILNSMAFYESSCQIGLRQHGAPNGIANGLFQLHEGHEQQYASEQHICKRGDSENPLKSITCAMSMLESQSNKEGSLFSDNSYWEVLRPKLKTPSRPSRQASNIIGAIQSYVPCSTEVVIKTSSLN